MDKKLQKNDIRRLIILIAVLVVYLVIIFVAGSEKNGTFWIGLIFTLVAFLLGFALFKIVGSEGNDAKSRFYRIPIVKIGVYYLIVQLILGLLETLLSRFISWKVALIINLIILAVAVIGAVAADTMREEIERQDTVLKKKVATIRNLQSLSASLVGQCNDADAKAVLQKLADAFRYSDPVSSEATEKLESELGNMLGEIQTAIVDGEYDTVKQLSAKLEPMLNERNRVCKLNK